MTTTCLRRLTATSLAVGALLAGPLAGEVAGQAVPDSLNETYGTWDIRCGAGLTGCHVVQALTPKNSDKPVVRVTLFRPGGKAGALMLRALTPLGARLRAGTVVEIDGGTKLKMPIATCLDRGCLSEATVTPAQEVEMRTGTILAVMVVASEGGKTIRFELALDGVGAAIDRMNAL